MAEKSEIFKREAEPQPTTDQGARREESQQALGRLRETGEKLPAVDAVAIVRDGRDLSLQ